MRKVTWIMVAWSAAIAIWIVILLARAEPHCAHERFRSVCETNSNVSKGLGILLLACGWLLGIMILAAIRFLTRPGGKSRLSRRRRRPAVRGARSGGSCR